MKDGRGAGKLALDDLPGHPVVCALLDSLQSASAGRLAERVADVFGRLQTAREDGRLKDWATVLVPYP